MRIKDTAMEQEALAATAADVESKKSDGRVAYSDMFWLFFFGSAIGFVLEGLWDVLRLGVWGNHSALVWGPFCIIYGVGMAGAYLIFSALQNVPWWGKFFTYAIAGSALEFCGSLAQERVFGTVSWDYSHHAFNLAGRVSLQMTLIWGVLGLAFSYLLFPHVAPFLSKLRTRVFRFVCGACSVFMVANLLVSAASIMRWRERANEPEASNAVEAFLDQRYPDARMESLYSNMTFR